MGKREYYSVTEFAKLIGVHRVTVHKWIAEKKISYVVIGSRKFISIDEVERTRKNGE